MTAMVSKECQATVQLPSATNKGFMKRPQTQAGYQTASSNVRVNLDNIMLNGSNFNSTVTMAIPYGNFNKMKQDGNIKTTKTEGIGSRQS